MLDLRNLSKTFRGPLGPVPVLRDLSLRVAAGEFVAVQGPSGCGKSTLLLTAGGLLHPDQGQVNVAGQNMYALHEEARARLRASAIGFVFQQFHLVPYLNVVDNILTPTLAQRLPDARARAVALLEEFGLAHRQSHVPGQLSTGERQRVAIARALLPGPKVLLADEPTGNLDAANGRLVLEHLLDFAHSGGAVLLVTHDASAAALAQRIIRLGAPSANLDTAITSMGQDQHLFRTPEGRS